ncbi:hypothetical protein LDL08_32350 [Nonomuraea glycinis]|uniref:Uncharacterized protein n=1 Tax=Nonomuraea glycinis TaxID=2047744 RepID=A0A918E8K4_9ACTN|nr:hypothetical protein [Nonomuraea glycinis]MCA2180881.1 hypothetical protein [Nonomuraea glycinis]GGP12938.1 hypothetical protein GCM10012278_62720 [Nonomuraea glycinis]
MLRLGTTLLAVVLLLSCGHFLFGPRAYGFEEHAALAVWNWRTSGAEEIWHEGFVPLEDMSAIPPKVLKRIQHDEEYGWVVAGPLPTPPAEARVRWDDGSTMRVPVIEPRKAMMALSPWSEEETFPDDRAYHLTGATFTTMRLKTVRGMATVPAWRLYFSDLPEPIDQVAVDQKALGTVEGVIGRHSSDGQITDFELLGEHTLLVSYEYGRCLDRQGPNVYIRIREESDVVVLGVDIPDRFTGFCLGVGATGKGIIRLDEPLADRVLLEAGGRLPLLCRRAPNVCRWSGL